MILATHYYSRFIDTSHIREKQALHSPVYGGTEPFQMIYLFGYQRIRERGMGLNHWATILDTVYRHPLQCGLRIS